MKRLVAFTTAALLLAACSQGLPPTTGTPELRATLNVLVLGLPSGQAAAITVRGPAGQSVSLTGAQQLEGLLLGQYEISAERVTAGELAYTPSLDVQGVTLDAQHLQQDIHVTYTPPSTGSLTVKVAGLPAGTAATLHLTGPDGRVRDLGSLDTQTLSDLTPGSYTLTADPLDTTSGAYIATVDPLSITVAAGRTASVNVSYLRAQAPQGALSVRVSGLPGGTALSLVLTDALGHPHTVSGSAVLSELPPGVASVPAQDLLVGGLRYHTAGGSVTVVAGQSSSLLLAFQAVSGALTVGVNSPVPLPSDLVQVSGPGVSRSLRATTTLTDQTPGSYSVTAQAFTQGGYTYTPTVTPGVLPVQAGLIAGATVSYTPSAVSPGVSADVTPPTVTLNPDPSGLSTALTGEAQDSAGPVRVQVFDDTTLLGTVNEVSGAWQLPWTPTPGEHRLTVIVTDAAGNTAQTAATIQVIP